MRRLIPLVLTLAAITGSPESLWVPGFTGYLSEGGRIAVGQTVVVDLTSGFGLSFESAGTENKRLILEFSGGEYGDLFSFLPTARSQGERSAGGESGWTMDGRLAVAVTAVDQGLVTISGSRTVSFDGKTDSVSLTARFDERDLSLDRRVAFDRLVNTRVSFATTAEAAGAAVLRTADLQQIIAEVEREAAAGVVPTGAPAATRYQIPLDRRQALLIRYINRIVDVLF